MVGDETRSTLSRAAFRRYSGGVLRRGEGVGGGKGGRGFGG